MSAREATHTDVQSLEEAQNVSCTRNILALNFVCLCDQVAKLGVPPKGVSIGKTLVFPMETPLEGYFYEKTWFWGVKTPQKGSFLLKTALFRGEKGEKRGIFNKNSPF